MGILNVTPDSFFDGGRFQELDFAVEHAAKMISEGASIIDIGGASSRPNAKILSPQQEIDRVVPVMERLLKSFPDILISIDTYHHKVAKEAIIAGASIINDISGGDMDAEMFDFVASQQTPYILTHIQGTPQNMQDNPEYKDVVIDVIKALTEKINLLEQKGVKDIVVDPGFGFGKTVEQNYSLLANIKLIKEATGKPVLAGLSRKSMIYKPLNITANDSLNATTAANVLAIRNGAQLLRVHDVLAAKEAVKICALMQSSYH